MKPQIVLVTASSAAEARKLARAALEAKLAACVQIVPGVESHYWWKGKLEQGAEFLVLIKSDAARFEELAAAIKKNHGYECPEIVAINPDAVEKNFLKWWSEAAGK